MVFPLTVLLTCFTKAHPVTYVFKAAAKLKCIVLWLLTRLANINFYEVYSGHNIPSTVNNFEDIGPTFNFSVKVSKCFWFWFEKLPPVAWSQSVVEKIFLISLSDFDAFQSVK